MPKRNITSRQVRIIKGKPYAEPPRSDQSQSIFS